MSAVRKSRLEIARPSMLPKPRRPASNDRASTDNRRPSGAGRSSSAEPARATLAVTRLSKDASATKNPLNRRSKSQSDRYGPLMTPLRSSQYPRSTTTPTTPSKDRMNWQMSVDRALAFVTVRDQRPISNVAWQRAELTRVGAALTERGLALMRPLTITRFVEIVAHLLTAIVKRDAKLNNDNYIAKLPNLAKKFLYPGAVSKSWLRTVNTLHAFPHALSFISYFLNIVTHIETPVSDEWLYVEKDELAHLRRDYFQKCWIRFQEEPIYDDLDAEYLEGVKKILGYDEQRLEHLKQNLQQLQVALDDPAEAAARAEETRMRARLDALGARLRAARGQRVDVRARAELQRVRRQDQAAAVKALDTDIDELTKEIQELKAELSQQKVSVEERARLLDEVDYSTRVADSKRTLADQVSKMLISKETELAAWQKRTLDVCVEYQQAMIDLAAHLPPECALAVDETQLMEAGCAAALGGAAEALRAHAHALTDRRAATERARAHLCHKRAQQLEEAVAKIAEVKAAIARSEQAAEADAARLATEAEVWAREQRTLADTLERLRASEQLYSAGKAELQFWEAQGDTWRKRMSEMQEYIVTLKDQVQQELESEKRKRADLVKKKLLSLHQELDRACALEEEEAKNVL